MITLLRLLLPGGLAVVIAVVLQVGPAAAQMPDQMFRIEYNKEAIPRGGWAVEGYVYNDSPRYLVSAVRLKVQVLDASGAVTGESLGWVYGNVTPGGKAYFAVPLPRRGADYRISVLSFTQNSIDAP